MDDIFLFKLLLSFLVGGGYIAFTLWLSEKFGSKLGGIAIGLPSTSLVSLVFIALTQNDFAAVSAIPIMPAVAGVNSIFVALAIFLSKSGMKKALGTAFVFWLVANLSLVLLPLDNLVLSLLLAGMLYYFSASYMYKFPHRKLPASSSSKQDFIYRSIFAGAVVATAVLLGKTLGPLWGGVFANFPAAFTSTLILVSRKHGRDFTASVARTMAFASISSVAFCVVFYLSVLPLGLVLGTAISFAVSLLAGYVLYKYFL